MKLTQTVEILRTGTFPDSREWKAAIAEVKAAIRAVVWPRGSAWFTINPSRGRGRGEGNGVKPIKEACMLALAKSRWSTDERHNPLRLDAVKPTADGRSIGLEWETGNISSSHRSINRLLDGNRRGLVAAGILIVPTRALYQYLTDRVGNLPELEPYFDLWREMTWRNGSLLIVAVEHDTTSEKVPRIAKGTDGRALL